MESTGVYWQPVWNILHESFSLLLTNAHQLKKVPGRKTDVLDAGWIAKFMQCGLLRGSFVPGKQIHQWRDLTGQRTRVDGSPDSDRESDSQEFDERIAPKISRRFQTSNENGRANTLGNGKIGIFSH